MSGNAGFLFYKDYYDGVDWGNIERNSTLFENKSNNVKNLGLDRYTFNIENLQSFTFITTYPGLVLGTGYHHETGVEGEFKIGFYFDHTTGLPVIPGSSVKGLLRSAFPNRENKKLTDEYKNPRAAYLQEIFEELKFENLESINIDNLELEIFEGIKNKDAKKASEKYLPMNERDIFHDAFPEKVSDDDGLFSDDFITPHGDNPLKNPIPLKFLKVSPGVSFQFIFDLKDGIITKEEKLKLLLNIVLDMGVGAKTNVGYGQFDASAKDKLLENIDKQVAEKEKQEKFDSMTPEERIQEEKNLFIEKIRLYDGPPKTVFDEWTGNSKLQNDKEVADAMLTVFKAMPSNPQLRYLARIIGIEKSELKKKFS